MAITNNISFYKGERVVLDFTMSPVESIAGWTITLTLRDNAADPDPVVLTVAGSIVSAAAGTFRFTLTHAQTLALGANRSYAYDVQRTDSGSECVLSIGLITLLQEVLY